MLYPYFGRGVKENERTVRINNVEITAFPGGHMDSARSLTNTRFFFLDEFDFFEEEKNIESSRKIAERQIAKLDTDILIATTPNVPGGAAETLQQEENSLYNKIMLPYTLGLGTIYTQQQIQENMKSHSFEQEYNLKYLGGIGNIFQAHEVDACIQEYNISGKGQFKRYIGVDPGYASSKFAIVVLQWRDSVMEIIHIENVKDILYTDSIKLLTSLISKYNPCKIYIDYAASSLIHELNHRYGYVSKYEQYYTETLRRFRWSSCKTPLFVPVSFGSNNEHKELMQNTLSVISKRKLRIHPKFKDIIVALKSAQSKALDQFSLDKSKSVENDLFDALRLSLISIAPH